MKKTMTFDAYLQLVHDVAEANRIPDAAHIIREMRECEPATWMVSVVDAIAEACGIEVDT